jgi:two-component system C4-dicarboxylate transport response regulator DctD
MSQERSNKAVDQAAARPGKVLLVDDQPELRRLFRRSLTREGHDVAEAWNGQSAIDLARRETFDAVVSDIQMPDMNGMDLLEGLMLLDPDLPVILVSGAFDPMLERRAAELGAFDYLVKPIACDRVNEAARRAIALRRACAEARTEFEPYASVERLRIPVEFAKVAQPRTRR